MIKQRILYFIGSLRSGGKERRLIELLHYLNSKNLYDLMLVVTMDDVHYPDFFTLNIPYKVIKKKWKRNDPTVFYQLYKICKNFRPDIIHTWGQIQSLYTLPAVIGQRVPLVNSQITGAPIKFRKTSVYNFINQINFYFSSVILSNSKAGIEAFKPPIKKSKIIYNGINLKRFENLPDVGLIRTEYGISTPYAVLMVASFSEYKNYDLFYRVAMCVTKVRDDVTFIGVGGYNDDYLYKKMTTLSANNSRVIFHGRTDEVEALVNACTIGVLFSTNGEGISNSIMEYMALAKPVIASAPGGTKEIVHHNENGYLISVESEEEIAALIVDLLNDKMKYESFGRASKKIIDETFCLESMGNAFEQVYKEVLKH